MTDAGWSVCAECGMGCNASEYHPYAACLMFKHCRNSETVRANLQAVRQQGRVEGLREAADFVDTQELIDPSGHSSREQLKIYDVLVKASDGIRKLAQQAQEGEGRGDESDSGTYEAGAN